MPVFSSSLGAEARATLVLAVPLAGANLAQIGMGLTNAVMVGHLGGAALAAAGLGGAINFTLLMICQGMLTAVAPLAAHAIGARDQAAAGHIAVAGFMLAVALTLPVLLLLSVASRGLALLGYEPSLAAGIGHYLAAIRWGSPAALAFTVLRALLAASARVRPVMIVLCCGFAANIAANWALIFGHLGMPALGIVGSGYASAIVQWLMMLGLAFYMLCGRQGLALRWSGQLRRHLGDILRIGLPISGLVGLETGLFNATGVLMGLLGAAALAAHQLAINTASVSFMVPLGIAQAATVRVAQHQGAGDIGAARRAAFVALALGAAFMVVPCALMLAVPRAIVGLYVDIADPANRGVALLAMRLLAIAAAFQVFDGIQTIAAGALRGYRDTAMPMLIAAFGYWVAGFAGGWTLAFPLGRGATGLWWGLALGLAIVALLLTARLHHRARIGYDDATAAPAQALP